MKNWTNLHNHTIFSMLDGHGDIEEYLTRAKSLGMSGLATTDHGNIHSWLDFYDAGQATGVKPILGSEFYQARKSRFDRDEEERSGPAKNEWEQRGPYHITILARNMDGYRNIIKMSSKAFLQGYYVKPRIDHDLIEEHAEGIIVLSGCLNGEVSQALLRGDFNFALASAKKMQDIVGKENYFIEVQNHGLEEQNRVFSDLVRIAEIIGAPVVPTGDCHYVHREDARAHDIMLCQPGGTKINVINNNDLELVNIEDVNVGDRVLSWDGSKRRGFIKKKGDIVTDIGVRNYNDNLIEVTVPDGTSSSYTKDHICIARLDSPELRDKYIVYLMKKDSKYRVGSTSFYRGKLNILGLVKRAKENGAEAAWIIGIFDSERAAREHEELVSLIFQIPTWTFYESKDRPNYLVSGWSFINDNSNLAALCLEHHGKDIRYPFWTSLDPINQRGPRQIRACNLLSGMLVCQYSKIKNNNGKLTTYHGSGAWQPISVNVVPFSGTVYSIEVDGTHTYVADDIVTHNCVATNATVDTPNRFSFSGDHFYLQSYEEMSKIFDERWLENSMKICDMIDLELKFGDHYFPDFPIPTNESSNDYFERLAWAGLKERYGDPLPQYVIDRANHELRVVKEMGFPEYFLVVSDLVQWAKNNDVRVGWGRGSAAGSILSYAFKITNLDPIKFGLMFERFLVEGRKSMPDIDLDFDDRYRDKVIDYARQKYGNDHVAHICTFNRTGARQSIRDAARALGYDYSDGDAISKLVPPPVLGISKTLDECMIVSEFSTAYSSDSKTKEIVDAALGLEGVVRQTGIHAAGIVISKEELTNYLPVMQKGADNPIVTQWDMGRVEQCGLLKIDFLGLRNLGVIDSCVKLIKKHRGIDIDIDQIPIDDNKTFDELCKGNSVGIFQLESSGMRNMMLAIQPRTIEDIMALISLYRPGPMGSGMDKQYIERKHGKSKIKYDHPKLEKVLSASLGIMLYQEDVLGVARELAGFTSAEADDLRKVIGKKQMEKIPKMRSKFVEGCLKTSDITKDKADKIFSDIEYFGGYGFNRAHAASYAMVSYITAYLKANYTIEYMAALMSSVVGKKEKQSFYLSDCRKLNINVLPPSINFSGIDFEVLDDTSIIFGLSAINGIGNSIAEAIIGCRNPDKPYKNLEDFFRRCDPIILKKTTIEHLACAGAFDELIFKSPNSYSRMEELKVLEKEKEELGIYVTKHPVMGIWDLLSKKIDNEIIDLVDMQVGSSVKIGGIITTVKKIITKKGQKMFKLSIEDITSDVEVIIFPNAAKGISEDDLAMGEVLIINGTLTRDGDEENSIPKVFFNSYEKLDSKLFSRGSAIILSVDTDLSPKTIDKIYDIINSLKGDKPVILSMLSGKHKYLYKFNIDASDKAESVIRELLELEK